MSSGRNESASKSRFRRGGGTKEIIRDQISLGMMGEKDMNRWEECGCATRDGGREGD